MPTRDDPFSRSPELEAIIRRWGETYGSREAAHVVDVFSDSACTTFLGSAPDELWQGRDLRRLFAAYTEEIPRFVITEQHIEAYQNGTWGWGFWLGLVTSEETGKPTPIRSTHIFHLEGVSWRVVHIHNSSPVANIESLGYDSAGVDALLASAHAGETDLGLTGIASVMFTDIADSTTLTETMGDAAWTRIVRAHMALVERCVAESGGTRVKSLGDGTLCAFSSAGAALRAAQAIQRDNDIAKDEPHLRLRIGLHTGDVIESGGDYTGGVVNKAARVAALAAPGEIRVSDATRAMVGGANAFCFADTITVRLKGLDGEHLIHRLEW